MVVKTRRFPTAFAVILSVVVALLVTGPAESGAQSIPPGFDLFETNPEDTELELQTVANVQVPAGFFGPGSDPHNGNVVFTGEPLGTFQGHHVGDADSVVQRTEAANPTIGSPDSVPIELVELSLISVSPIRVTYNNGLSPEDWDIRISLSDQAQSLGQITIERTSENGGIFDSQIQVVPFFTFIRLTDGTIRTLDGTEISPGGLNLKVSDVPWTSGCFLPAFAAPGLNDGFCPGLTLQGQLQLAHHKAAFVHHGVYPAQPALEHFKCYKLKRADFKDKRVTLKDQFGSKKVKTDGRGELCNPVQKNDEPFFNTSAHLVCYVTSGRDPKKVVAVRNQFGSQELLVSKARRLCVPSEKRESKGEFPPLDVPIDHYQCYGVEARSELLRLGQLGTLELNDQFGQEQADLGAPKQLCAPAQKDDEVARYAVDHLVCYAINGERARVGVNIRNQFEKKKLTVLTPVLLCVPSSKLVLSDA